MVNGPKKRGNNLREPVMRMFFAEGILYHLRETGHRGDAGQRSASDTVALAANVPVQPTTTSACLSQRSKQMRWDVPHQENRQVQSHASHRQP